MHVCMTVCKRIIQNGWIHCRMLQSIQCIVPSLSWPSRAAAWRRPIAPTYTLTKVLMQNKVTKLGLYCQQTNRNSSHWTPIWVLKKTARVKGGLKKSWDKSCTVSPCRAFRCSRAELPPCQEKHESKFCRISFAMNRRHACVFLLPKELNLDRVPLWCGKLPLHECNSSTGMSYLLFIGERVKITEEYVFVGVCPNETYSFMFSGATKIVYQRIDDKIYSLSNETKLKPILQQRLCCSQTYTLCKSRSDSRSRSSQLVTWCRWDISTL